MQEQLGDRHLAPVAYVPRMIISAINDLPGDEVEEVFGEMLGLTVRSRSTPA
jgi:hypothetical protein